MPQKQNMWRLKLKQTGEQERSQQGFSRGGEQQDQVIPEPAKILLLCQRCARQSLKSSLRNWTSISEFDGTVIYQWRSTLNQGAEVWDMEKNCNIWERLQPNNKNSLRNKNPIEQGTGKSWMRHKQIECIGQQCQGSEKWVRLGMTQNSLGCCRNTIVSNTVVKFL